MSACGKATGKSSAIGAPNDLMYLDNPAAYTQGVEITPNTITASGSAVKLFSVKPDLPKGLVLDTATGTISGTPTEITPSATYRVTAVNGSGSNYVKLEIAVNDVPPTISYSGATTLNYQVGTPITTITPTLDGGATTSCSSSPTLPPGLTLSSQCEISGVPTAPVPLTTYIVSANNSGGSASLLFDIVVIDIPPVLSFGGSPYSFTRGVAITTVSPTNTGGAVTSCSVTPDLPAGLSLSATCEIKGTPTALSSATTYTLTGTNTGGSDTKTISLEVKDVVPVISYTGGPFSYTKGTAIAALSPTRSGGTIDNCAVSPALPAGLSLSTSTCEISGTPTEVVAAADYTVTASNTAGSTATTVNLQIKDIPPTLSYDPTTYSFPRASAITAISPTAGGGAITACASSPSLPAGLSLSATGCVISGTPTAVSAETEYTITASNSGGDATAKLKITIRPIKPALTYAGNPYTFHKAVAISTVTPGNTGDVATSCSSTPDLPAGLSLSSACSISGTPTSTAAQGNYTITASNSAGSSAVIISITVTDTPPTLSYVGSPLTYTKGTGVTTLTPTNSGGAITSCVSTPTLPAGLILSSGCVISGTPTAVAAAADYTITGTNDGGSANAVLNITVNDVPPSITYAGTPYSFTLNSAISTKTPANTGGTIVSCAANPSLPTGLSLSSTCDITGTPTAITASAAYTITATNSGGTSSVAVVMAVNDAAPVIDYGATTTFIYTKGTAITTLTPTTSGGTITSCVSSPDLPTGLSLSSTCVITGTPSAVRAATNYTITASNTGGSSSKTLNITVNDVIPNISYSGSPFTYTKDSAITTLTPTNTGGTVTTCSSNPVLPGGLSLSNTCVITGTPTAIAAAANYTITATNSGGSATASVNITVNDVAPTLSYAGSPLVYTKDTAIATLTPTNTGGAITSCASSATLPAGLSLSSTCVLSGTPTAVAAAADYAITGTNSGGSASATLNIAVKDIPPSIAYASASYTLTKGSAITDKTPTNTGGAIVSCASNPALPTGLSLSSNCVISGTPTAISANATYTITATNTGGTANAAIDIVVNDVAPSIAYAGSPYVFTKDAAITDKTPSNTGGTIVSCSSSPALPAGLSLSSTCVISGTPTGISGATAYTVTATNTGGSSNASISVTVNDVAPDIAYSGSPFTFTKDSAIANKTPANSGGTVTGCSSSPALPAGLSLSSACVISGTPTAITSTANYVITATNTGGTDQDTVTITVNDVAPTLSYSGSPFTFTKDSAISNKTPTNTGGTITSCSSNPTLPSGLSLSSTCVISGTPTAITSAADYVITAANTGGSASATVNITVNDVVPNIAYSGAPYTFTKDSAITDKTPTNSGGGIVSCASNPVLPTGLSLSSTCVISGTPTSITANATYTITATNTGGSANATIDIRVNDVAPSIAYAGSPYSFVKDSAITDKTPSNTGGTITSCSSNPSLPTGLSLSSTCVISGTPTAITSAAAYTISATNSGGTSSASVSITVNDVAPSISYSGSPYTFTKDSAISDKTPTHSGGTVTACSSNPALPAGLSLSSTCVISGTPTAITSTTNYVITATNTGGTDQKTITITVNDVAPTLSYSGSPYSFTKDTVITNKTPSNTGGTITSCSSNPSLPTGLSLSSTCVISGTPTVLSAATDYTITASNTGGSVDATVNITVKDVIPSISYSGSPYTFTKDSAITSKIPSNGGGTITSCSSNPALPTGLSLSSTCVISGTPTAIASNATYTVTATNSGGNADTTVDIRVNDVAPTLSYAGAPYAFTKDSAIVDKTPTNTGGGITSCSSNPALPAGLSLSSACVISGTPTAITATANYAITATNSGGSVSATLSITVNDAAPGISYSGGPYDYTKGSAIADLTPANSGGTVTSCSSNPALPSGLSLSSTCVISGTPTAVASSQAYVITATNTGGSSSDAITITVKDVAPTLSYSDAPYSFIKDSAITNKVPTNTGGTITSCSSNPALPGGLSLSSTCVISGTPTAMTATATYTVTGTNSGGSASANVSITVNDVPPSISFSGSPYTFVKDSAITDKTPSNSGGTVTSCSSNPTLPTGLSLSSACVISGTPTAIASAANYTITATNSGGTSQATINITVNDIAPDISYGGSPYTFTKDSAITDKTPANTGGTPTVCSINPSLPAGLSLSSACVISGTPTAVSATASYTITATNSGGTDSTTVSITVNDVAPSITYAGSPYTFTKDSAITDKTPTNAGGTITSCSSNPGLPAGLSLSSACVISGTPSAVTASASYTITATNTGGSGSRSITIAVNDIAPVLGYGVTTHVYTLRTAISTLNPTNTGGTITSCSSSPALPAGLSLSSTCVLTGTPTSTSSATNYTITATNSGGSSQVTLSLRVKNLPQILFYSLTAIGGSANGTAPGSNNIWKVSSDGVDKVALTQNTNASLDSQNPVWSSDGTKVSYLSRRALNGATNGSAASSYNIWTSTGTGSSPNARTSNSNASLDAVGAPVFSPNGSKIAFVSKMALDGSANGAATSSYNLWVMNADGTGKLALTANLGAGYDSIDPVFAPNGTTIYFASKNALDGSADGTVVGSYNIWKVNTDGTGLTALTTENGAGKDSREPALSSDGSVVLYRSLADIGVSSASSYNVWKMDSDGSNKTALTSNTGAGLDSQNARFSPDDSEIVFASRMNVNAATANSYNIWTMTAAGGSQTALTDNNDANLDSVNPSFSSDGARIVFSSTMDISGVPANSSNIWIMNSNGASVSALTTNTNVGLDSYLAPHGVWYAE